MAIVLPGFLSFYDYGMLYDLYQETVSNGAKFVQGRQGTGYLKLPINNRIQVSFRALKELAALTPTDIANDRVPPWDSYFIVYHTGQHVPPHTDPVEPGKRHRRMNMLLNAPKSGGRFLVNGEDLNLVPGDAVLFYPDQEIHEVTEVVGERWIYSVGCVL